jgi:hypothetical protein
MHRTTNANTRSRRALAAFALLAGNTACSTTSIADLQQREPSAVYTTSRPASAIATCLVEQLGHLGAPNVYERGTATIVSFSLEGDTTGLFTIEPGRVQVRMLSRIIPFRKKSQVCF